MRMRPAAALLLVLAAQAPGQQPAAPGFWERAQAGAAAMAPLPACPAPRPEPDGRIRRHPLPERILGAAAGTTGGLGRNLITVTSAADDPSAPEGTLRAALLRARREGGGWITFAPGLAGQTISLARGLRVPADTTLDGGCGGVTLHAPAYETTLLVADASNVIISGLNFSKTAYQEPDARIADVVGLRGSFDRVAVLNNAFTRCGDGCVDVVRRTLLPTQGRVTVAFNRFENHNKVMLVGTLACTRQSWIAACDRPLEYLDEALRPTIRLTLLGNVFLGTSQRHPKAVAGAFVHSVNNLMLLAPTRYATGEDSAVYGAVAASGGLIAAEGDIIIAAGPRERLGLGPVSAQRHSGAEAREADGAVAVAGVVALGGVRIVPHREELARMALAAEPDPVRARHAGAQATDLAACLLRGAGPAGAALRWVDLCPPMRVNLDRNPVQSLREAAARGR